MNPDDVMDVYVPGAWKCLKCQFQLSQATIFMGSGEIGCSREQVMKMSGELCPNDGEPMARVTWRDRAEDNRKWGESLMEDIIGAVYAEHLPGALAAIKRHYAALQSISRNSCCGSCQEAKMVALRALEEALPPERPAVRGEDFWIDELEFQLGRPMTPIGRNYLRTWLRAFAANVKRLAVKEATADPAGATPLEGQQAESAHKSFLGKD